jgi:hypothetical protein
MACESSSDLLIPLCFWRRAVSALLALSTGLLAYANPVGGVALSQELPLDYAADTSPAAQPLPGL